MPAISPPTALEQIYSIQEAKAFVVDSLIDISPDNARSFTVIYPELASAGVTLVLLRLTEPDDPNDSNLPINLTTLATPEGNKDDDSISGRDITATRLIQDGFVKLTCEIGSNDGNGAFDELYEVRASAGTAITWTYQVQDGVPNTRTSQVIRAVCDPVAGIFTELGSLLEKQLITLRADGAGIEDGAPTIVLHPTMAENAGLEAPTPTYKFGHQGPLVIDTLPTDPSEDPRITLRLPGVYGSTTVPFTMDVKYLNIGGSDTFLTGHGEKVGTIATRPERIQLVLDRSGSMGTEHRWDNAKTAARLFINFFGAFRGGVDGQDRIGVTVFSDPGPNDNWRSTGPAGPPFITDVIPLGSPAAVSAGDLGPAVFGNFGGSTPLGDGLFFALRKLQELDDVPNVRHTVVLCSDGAQNTGTIKVGPPPVPGDPRDWELAKTDPAIKAVLDEDLTLHTVGLGSAPDKILNDLAKNKQNTGDFVRVNSVGELINAFATIFGKHEANKLDIRATRVKNGPLPTGPITEVFFDTTEAAKFAVAVLKVVDPAADNVTDKVEIALWDGGEFKTQNIQARPFEGHFFLNEPDAGGSNGGSGTWRIRRFHGETLQTLALDDVCAFEDLHVKSTLSLDKRDYLTGEKMHLSVEIRNDGDPVLGATVRATLDAPAEGLGALVAGLDADDLEQELKNEDIEDGPQGETRLHQAVLRKYRWHDFPRHNPDSGGLFVDGTNLLHDFDGNGVYTNIFAKVHVEGAYNWSLTADGVDRDQNPFGHRLDQTVLAGIGVSRRATTVRRDKVPADKPSNSAVKVTITPQDDFGGLLGPGHDDAVVWVLSNGGAFDHIRKGEPAPVNTDGTYTRTVVFKRGTRPTLRVSVNGVILPKIELAH